MFLHHLDGRYPATLQRDLVRPLVDLNFGPRKQYPKLLIARPDTEDVTALIDNVVKLLGVKSPDLVEVSVLRDKLGLPEPAKGAVCVGGTESVPPVLSGKAMQRAEAANPVEPDPRDHIDDMVDAELEGWERVISPLVNPIQRLAAECENAQEFLDRLPDVISEQDAATLARSLAESAFAARVLAEQGEHRGNA